MQTLCILTFLSNFFDVFEKKGFLGVIEKLWTQFSWTRTGLPDGTLSNQKTQFG
jgi:hypothetical protein